METITRERRTLRTLYNNKRLGLVGQTIQTLSGSELFVMGIATDETGREIGVLAEAIDEYAKPSSPTEVIVPFAASAEIVDEAKLRSRFPERYQELREKLISR